MPYGQVRGGVGPSLQERFPDIQQQVASLSSRHWPESLRRGSARDYLLNRAEAKETEARQLRALAAALPQEFDPEAESALWDLLADTEHR
jgi:hypothetical protein